MPALASDSDLSDPTRPAKFSISKDTGFVQKATNGYKLSQIYISHKNRVAIINGLKVKTGDWIEGAKVIAIKHDSVRLLIEKDIREIAIMPSIKKYRK